MRIEPSAMPFLRSAATPNGDCHYRKCWALHSQSLVSIHGTGASSGLSPKGKLAPLHRASITMHIFVHCFRFGTKDISE